MREKSNVSSLLPGIQLRNVYRASCYGNKFKSGGIVICSVDESIRPIFGTTCVLWIISDFIYIEYMPLETLCFSEQFQAYHVKMCEDVGTQSSVPMKVWWTSMFFTIMKTTIICASEI